MATLTENTDAHGRALVVIPTYNEVDNIRTVVHRTVLAAPDVDVLIVDDNSPDGTGEVGDQLSAANPSVHVLHRAGKDGIGSAYREGFAWALRRGYTAVVEMDADGSHQPEEVPRLLKGLEIADVALGSRWVPGGRAENWPRHREWLSRFGNLYARRLLGLQLRDATGGFRAFRRDALVDIGLENVESRGYCFQVDMAHRAVAAGMSAVEVPIVFRERERGKSKMSAAIVAEALWRIAGWSVTRRGARPLRPLPAVAS